MDKGKSAMPLLAIVAIVAVVAVVMVVLQGRTPSSEEAVAGEAFKATLQTTAPSSVCNNLESQCGFLQKDKVLAQRIVPLFEIVDFYGNHDFQRRKSAARICEEMGYKGCFAGKTRLSQMFFESTDGRCVGMQFRDGEIELGGCNALGVTADSSNCSTFLNSYLREPFYGDSSSDRILLDVICLE